MKTVQIEVRYPSNDLTHKDRIVQFLTDKILTGRIKPGERLNESRLARELGLSRIPVREALQTLEEQGLVVTIPRRGKFVVNLSEEQTQKINSLRLIFEAEALRLCKTNLRPKGEKRLSKLIEQMESVGTISESEASKLDLEFHRTIWSLSGNEYLEKTLTMLTVPLFSHRIILHQNSAGVNGSMLKHHWSLLAFVRGMSNCSAEEVMLEHLRLGFENPEKYSSYCQQRETEIVDAFEGKNS